MFRIDKKLRPEELGCLVVRAGELLPTMNNGDAAGVLGALARLSPDIPPSQAIAALVDTAWSRVRTLTALVTCAVIETQKRIHQKNH
jgi:hypothetical protein